MNIELKALDGDVEGYSVWLEEQQLGIAKRKGPEAWSLVVEGHGSDDLTVTIAASDRAELRKVLSQRIATLELKPDRLTERTMRDYSMGILETLNVLANKTGAIPAYIRALADAFATTLVEDVKPDKIEEVRGVFNRRVDETFKGLRERAEMKEVAVSALAAIFAGKHEEKPDAPKH